MIFDLVRNGLSIELIINLCVRVFIIFCVLPIHEFAHGLVACKLGDDTARLKGRLTMNPLAHIDPFGALMVILVGFGYAKPVPVNLGKFKRGKRKQYMALTALAGPVSNLIMATIFTFVYCLIYYKLIYTAEYMYYVALFCSIAAQINISLAVFNLLPIPPLDGSRILNAFLPDRLYFKLMQYERYIVLAVFALILMNVLDGPIAFLTGLIESVIFKICQIPFI